MLTCAGLCDHLHNPLGAWCPPEDGWDSAQPERESVAVRACMVLLRCLREDMPELIATAIEHTAPGAAHQLGRTQHSLNVRSG